MVLRKYWRSYKFDGHNTRSLLNSAADRCFDFRPDLIVFGTFSCEPLSFSASFAHFALCFCAAGAYDIAEALRVPAVVVYLAPKTPTTDFPMHLLQLSATNTANTPNPLCRLLAAFLRSRLCPAFVRAFLNRASYVVYDFVSWHPLRAVFNEFRRERLKLPALPWWLGPRERAHAQKMLTVYSYSERCVSRCLCLCLCVSVFASLSLCSH